MPAAPAAPTVDPAAAHETRRKLLRTGMELFTERGFDGVGLADILGRSRLPKGCFYHHFENKERYVIAVIEAYDVWFSGKLERNLGDDTRPALGRLDAFMQDALAGLRRHNFKRGCLVGNLGQEMGGHTPAVRAALDAAWSGWEARMARLFRSGQAAGELPPGADCDELAALFWTGWEGAILRAKLLHAPGPVIRFSRHFLLQLKTVHPLTT